MTKQQHLLFKKFSDDNKSELPFSLHYEWWTEVVKSNWDLALIHNQNQVSAIWPYFIRKKGPFKLICQPHFTPYSGIFISYPNGQKPSTKVAYEEKTINALINQLPNFSELEQNFHLSFYNSLPLIWSEFQDTKRFTYILNLEKSEEYIWLNFRDNIRKQIKKAEETLIIQESNSQNLKKCFDETFESQGKNSPIDDDEIFERINNYIKKYDCGFCIEAIDAEQNLHAAMLCIYDHKQAYYLIGGSAKDYNKSGAMSLLQWEAIKKTKAIGLNAYNFEGSSIKSIEKYLRGFGGELVSFSRIQKKDSKTLNFIKGLKS